MARKPARRVLELITTVPWAITAEALQTIIAVANREGLEPEAIAKAVYGRVPEPEALAAKPGEVLPGTYAVTLRDGVATIPMIGPMFRYADFFTQMSGGTTYDALAMDLAAARDSADVGAILLDVDSPGGEANGVAELAAMIVAMRGVKPVVAYVGGMGASAAYWLASAASEIVVNATAMVGSIGVRMELMETWMRDASRGLRTISLVSTQSPRKALATADIQLIIDELATQFVEGVARNRGVSAETVLADFGQGGLFVGQAAIDAGLADRLGTYESIHAELAAEVGGRSLPMFSRLSLPSPARALAATPMEEAMKTTDKPDAPAAGASATAATPPEQLTAAQVAERHPNAAAALRLEGATAERARILAIEDLTVAGAEEIIAAAKQDGSTPEATAVKVVQHQRANPPAAAAPAGAASEPGKKHLANMAGDEANANAPTAQTSKAEASVAEAVAGLVKLSSLRPAASGAAQN